MIWNVHQPLWPWMKSDKKWWVVEVSWLTSVVEILFLPGEVWWKTPFVSQLLSPFLIRNFGIPNTSERSHHLFPYQIIGTFESMSFRTFPVWWDMFSRSLEGNIFVKELFFTSKAKAFLFGFVFPGWLQVSRQWFCLKITNLHKFHKKWWADVSDQSLLPVKCG